MGTHLRVPSESILMNTNMTRFGWFSKLFYIFLPRTKLASAWKGLYSLKMTIVFYLAIIL